MKKLLAIVLALVLTLSMATIAFAANDQRTEPDPIKANDGTAKAEVWVLIDEGTLPDNPGDVDPEDPDVVYSVSIDATAADFTYTFDSDYNPATHKYEGGSWDKLTADIKVTNDSNTKVGISAKWEGTGEKDGVKATLANTTFDLESAVNKAVDDASLTKNITVTIVDDAEGTSDGFRSVPSTFDNFVLDYVVITVTGK